MFQFTDRDPTGFCNSEPDTDQTGFRKNATGSNMDVQTALITTVKCLIRGFFRHEPDRIKYLDNITGLGSVSVTQ